jgi:hypothetical protein
MPSLSRAASSIGASGETVCDPPIRLIRPASRLNPPTRRQARPGREGDVRAGCERSGRAWRRRCGGGCRRSSARGRIARRSPCSGALRRRAGRSEAVGCQFVERARIAPARRLASRVQFNTRPLSPRPRVRRFERLERRAELAACCATLARAAQVLSVEELVPSPLERTQMGRESERLIEAGRGLLAFGELRARTGKPGLLPG